MDKRTLVHHFNGVYVVMRQAFNAEVVVDHCAVQLRQVYYAELVGTHVDEDAKHEW